MQKMNINKYYTKYFLMLNRINNLLLLLINLTNSLIYFVKENTILQAAPNMKANLKKERDMDKAI